MGFRVQGLGIYSGCIGIMEKRMEATIHSLGSRLGGLGLGFGFGIHCLGIGFWFIGYRAVGSKAQDLQNTACDSDVWAGWGLKVCVFMEIGPLSCSQMELRCILM